MPARSRRSMIRGERLAGPMVHTILEGRKAMVRTTHRQKRNSIPGPAELFGDRKLRDDTREHLDPFVERRDRDAFAVAVHALHALASNGTRQQAIRLTIAQPQR